MIRLLIADDDSLIRESLKIIIGMDKEFDILAAVENGKQAVEFCESHDVDVAILDVRMPIMNGVEAIREINKSTQTKCLILTTFDEDEYIKDAISYGAKGYILKNNTPDKIKDAIRVVYNGSSVMQDVVMEKVKSGFNKVKIDVTKFTERELDIMEAISEGLSNKEIAAKLFISEGTVKNYISTILDKTGLDHRTQIAIYYIKGKV
ncbi:response regulator transcription factor [Clostridium oryzae]|uniref:response regulator transcription factor n=1 Tax=Clostridium oryzae TaxID=1450648 RepID=UPI0009A4FF81|nr:response regulator transcription factor [Clostridium oryzae]